MNFNDTLICNSDNGKWVYHTKGGEYRKWYGNQEDVLNYDKNGEELRKFPASSLTGQQNYFKECISYSRITSAKTSFRYTEKGAIPNMAGLALYAKPGDMLFILGWLNTKIVCELLKITNPTINFPPGTIGKIPVCESTTMKAEISEIVKKNVLTSKEDWDSFETSWNFKRHPLI